MVARIDALVTKNSGGTAARAKLEAAHHVARRAHDADGHLVGGLVVQESDEIIAIKHSGQITRSGVTEVPVKGRDTMGVRFVGVKGDDAVSLIALNPENSLTEETAGDESTDPGTPGHDGAPNDPTDEVNVASAGADEDADQAEEDDRE